MASAFSPQSAIRNPQSAMRRAALVGNPNTGKTTLFNALSGLNQRVGNYPGVTVETKKGRMTCAGEAFDLIDLPGTYSLAPRSPDEMVAVDVILGAQKGESRPDVVVCIVDASNLDRNLYLMTQALDLGVPVVVALNMIDVAQGHGVQIDVEVLSRSLGVPVVPIQGNKGKGLDKLREAIASAAKSGVAPQGPPFPDAFQREEAALRELLGDTPAYLVRRLLLDVGGYTERRLTDRLGDGVRAQVQEARARLAAAGCAVPAVEARARYAWIHRITAGCVRRPKERPVTWTDRLDRVLTHKVWGTLVFLVLMFLVFESIFFVARWPMRWIGAGKDGLADVLRAGVEVGYLPKGPASDLLINGILEGVGSVLVFLPQILILFAFIAILEDCGYMARAAFLMDKLMARCGLSGKSFIPMLSSVACAVPGIMATRVIENRRDRLVTILVAPLMSCSARLPVYILLIAAFFPVRDAERPDGFAWYVPGLVMFSMYMIGLVVAPVVALLLKRTLLRGETPVFVMEMPLYKFPSWRTVVRRMFDSGWAFVYRAGTLILASMVLVWALLYFPSQDYPERIDAAEKVAKNTDLSEEEVKAAEVEGHRLEAEWKQQSALGRLGHAIEPAVRPLGWDWQIGVAALASFPAREVVVGTLGILYQTGKVDSDELRDADDLNKHDLVSKLRGSALRPASALSLMVFFALCCQCASTLAVIKRETRTWRWPAFTFTYMTALAYVGALVVFQVARLIPGLS
jgi:ferrous iron transport protein B